MTDMVYLLSTWQKEPVYHAYGRTDREGKADLSICGLVLYKDGTDHTKAFLRQDHADLFARPCGHCFVVEEELAA